MNYNLIGGEPLADVKAAFLTGNFDYLPDKTADVNCGMLNESFLVNETHPSDTYIPSMPTATVEALAESNVRRLINSRASELQTDLELFAAMSVRPGLALPAGAGFVAVKQALVAPNTQIAGHIAGPNRQMLDLVYEEVGVKGKPEIDTQDVAGIPLLNFGDDSPAFLRGAPDQKQTHRKLRVALRSKRLISSRSGRPRFDEIEVEYVAGKQAGTVDALVRLER